MHVASLRDDHVGAQRCPLCHAALATDVVVTACEACGTVAHAECLRDLARARCPTLGCALAVRGVVAGKPAAWLSRRAAVVAGLVALPIMLLAGHEWRAHAAYVAWQHRADESGFRDRDPTWMRAMAAELRALPRGILDQRSHYFDPMSNALDSMAAAIEQERRKQDGREIMELRERMIREVLEKQHP